MKPSSAIEDKGEKLKVEVKKRDPKLKNKRKKEEGDEVATFIVFSSPNFFFLNSFVYSCFFLFVNKPLYCIFIPKIKTSICTKRFSS